MIQKSDFFGYDSFTISSERLSVRVMTLGATVIDFRFDGRPVALRFETAQEYLDSDAYLGAIVGRYANRIGGARFTLNGKTYELPANEGKNQLHGGKNSYDRRIWDAEVCGDSAVRFRLFSPDGDNGYPGNLSIAVTYTVAGDRMRIDFEGDCDADTYFAPTTHLYFNLGGAPTVLDTRLWINPPDCWTSRRERPSRAASTTASRWTASAPAARVPAAWRWSCTRTSLRFRSTAASSLRRSTPASLWNRSSIPTAPTTRNSPPPCCAKASTSINTRSTASATSNHSAAARIKVQITAAAISIVFPVSFLFLMAMRSSNKDLRCFL